jgi:hypothetical protein
MSDQMEAEASKQVTLAVYRLLDNRFEGLSDDSPRALELHERRKVALHEALDGNPAVTVTSWGDTDDVASHELVTVILLVVGHAVLNHVLLPGGQWLAEKLAEKLVDEGVRRAIDHIVDVFRKKQTAEQLNDFTATLHDGTWICVRPPKQGGTISIGFVGENAVSISYLGASDGDPAV